MNIKADQTLIENWSRIRLIFKKSFFSSFHYAIASLNPDGTPHVAPIGSLILDDNEPKGFYFEIFTIHTRKNLESNPNVCVLAVNSGVWFWLKSLIRGKFQGDPALRLYGTVGSRRTASIQEVRRWQRRIGPLRVLKGYKLLWENLTHGREIRFHKFEPVKMGQMTQVF